MSGSIIQTAVSKPGLRLELEYRIPSSSTDNRDVAAGPVMQPGFTMRFTGEPVSNELACLLSVI